MPDCGERDCEYLFAYGTLQPDRAPAEVADVVRGFEWVGKGTVRGTLYDLGSYPGAVLNERGWGPISGIVFRLPVGENILGRLDAYEEFDPQSPKRSLFIRRLHPVELDNGRVLPCWIYEYNGRTEGIAIIESGMFRPPAGSAT